MPLTCTGEAGLVVWEAADLHDEDYDNGDDDEDHDDDDD